MLALTRNTTRFAVIAHKTIRNLCSYQMTTPQLITNGTQQLTNTILVPALTTITQARGMKQVGFVRRRCKDCFFVRREDRLYNICKTHPRHKQMQQKKSEKNSWILSHATQGKVRPW